jgi:hypothetical protein
MHKRLWLFLAVSCLLVVTRRTVADEAPKLNMKPLYEEVRKLVEKRYPKAKVSLKDQTIHFEFNTRKFMIHEMTRIGDRWQDAHEEPGPQPDGIYCDIELRPGQYLGALVLPHNSDKRYFTLSVSAPYSKKLDRHLYIHLKYPSRVSKEFLKDFNKLMDGFDTHVTDKAK